MAISIAVSSGKGGVGKTSISVNLALTLRNLGSRVYLFDSDYGMANAHVLMGINPQHAIDELISETVDVQSVACDGPNGLKLISGGAGLVEMLNIEKKVRYQTIRAMNGLANDTDYLVADVAAGASDSSIAFVAAADRILVILVGEPTSFLDAYALIKAANLETGAHHFNVMVNMASTDTVARSHFDKFQATVMKFLDVTLHYVGSFPMSNKLRQSIVARRPVVLDPKNKTEITALQRIAANLIRSPINQTDGIKFFDKPEPDETEI